MKKTILMSLLTLILSITSSFSVHAFSTINYLTCHEDIAMFEINLEINLITKRVARVYDYDLCDEKSYDKLVFDYSNPNQTVVNYFGHKLVCTPVSRQTLECVR